MKRISFDKRFVNEAGDGLIAGKIHTIRQNYEYWKKFEGKELSLFTWEGKPYRKGSKQKVFCVKKLIYVQLLGYASTGGIQQFYMPEKKPVIYSTILLAKNDGFTSNEELFSWFANYDDSDKMAILHFTDFRY